MNQATVTFAHMTDGMGRRIDHKPEIIAGDHVYIDYAAAFLTVVAFDKDAAGTLIQPARRLVCYPAHVLVKIELERDGPEPATIAVVPVATAPAAGKPFDPDEIPF